MASLLLFSLDDAGLQVASKLRKLLSCLPFDIGLFEIDFTDENTALLFDVNRKVIASDPQELEVKISSLARDTTYCTLPLSIEGPEALTEARDRIQALFRHSQTMADYASNLVLYALFPHQKKFCPGELEQLGDGGIARRIVLCTNKDSNDVVSRWPESVTEQTADWIYWSFRAHLSDDERRLRDFWPAYNAERPATGYAYSACGTVELRLFDLPQLARCWAHSFLVEQLGPLVQEPSHSKITQNISKQMTETRRLVATPLHEHRAPEDLVPVGDIPKPYRSLPWTVRAMRSWWQEYLINCEKTFLAQSSFWSAGIRDLAKKTRDLLVERVTAFEQHALKVERGLFQHYGAGVETEGLLKVYLSELRTLFHEQNSPVNATKPRDGAAWRPLFDVSVTARIAHLKESLETHAKRGASLAMRRILLWLAVGTGVPLAAGLTLLRIPEHLFVFRVLPSDKNMHGYALIVFALFICAFTLALFWFRRRRFVDDAIEKVGAELSALRKDFAGFVMSIFLSSETRKARALAAIVDRRIRQWDAVCIQLGSELEKGDPAFAGMRTTFDDQAKVALKEWWGKFADSLSVADDPGALFEEQLFVPCLLLATRILNTVHALPAGLASRVLNTGDGRDLHQSVINCPTHVAAQVLLFSSPAAAIELRNSDACRDVAVLNSAENIDRIAVLAYMANVPSNTFNLGRVNNV